MGFFDSSSSYTNKQKKKYWLHSKTGRGGTVLYYFSTEPAESIPMPPGYYVIESSKTGLPVLKKIR
jgi:hypothetical protein